MSQVIISNWSFSRLRFRGRKHLSQQGHDWRQVKMYQNLSVLSHPLSKDDSNKGRESS